MSDMPLKITLKSNEKLIVGGAVIRNGNGKCELVIENTTPVLREPEILSAEAADSPCRRLYFIIQLMYIDEDNIRQYHQAYWDQTRRILDAAPSMLGMIDGISDRILQGQYYRALKKTRELIQYEEELLENV